LSATYDIELEDYLPLLLHTATRSEETRSMKLSDIDLERAVWTIPPEASKTGEITGEPHIVPLSAGALHVLSRRRAQKVAPLSPYVFPAPSGGYMGNPSRGIATVRKRSGVADFRLHDVRRTVSQRIAEEFGEGISHSILGHARQRLGRIYIPNRPLKEQREGLEWWSAELGRLLEATSSQAATLGRTSPGLNLSAGSGRSFPRSTPTSTSAGPRPWPARLGSQRNDQRRFGPLAACALVWFSRI
jgi:hypothetical protein